MRTRFWSLVMPRARLTWRSQVLPKMETTGVPASTRARTLRSSWTGFLAGRRAAAAKGGGRGCGGGGAGGGAGFDEGAAVAVLVDGILGEAGAAEGSQPGVVQGEVGSALEELLVFGVAARPAALNVINT